MSKVYVVQNMLKRNDSGELVPKYDLTPAERWGEIIPLVSPTAKPFNSKQIISEMRDKLCDYSDEDFILPIGNVCLIAMATTIASKSNNGTVRLLQWNGANHCHFPIICNF